MIASVGKQQGMHYQKTKNYLLRYHLALLNLVQISSDILYQFDLNINF